MSRTAKFRARVKSFTPHFAVEAAGLSGVGLVVYGIALIYFPAGLIAAGIALIASAWLGVRALGRGGRSTR